VNVELAVASLQETVTVTGDSPVIDTLDARPAELQARSAAGNPELARPVVAARR
jgi:hypothetical protein